MLWFFTYGCKLTGSEVIFLIENSEFFIMDLFQRLKIFLCFPQGSCLGPLLFFILINYVADKANIFMYADDSTMFSAAHTLAELQKKIK